MEKSDALSQAQACFDAGNLSSAILALEAVVKQNPNDADSWRLLGQCHAENEEESQAIAALTQAISLDPYNLEALLLLSVSYTNGLEQARALNLLKNWLERSPEYQALVGDEDAKNFEEMYGSDNLHMSITNMFLKASSISQDPEVMVALGVLYNISSEYEEAVNCFRKASQLKPADASIWNKLGATLANSERSDVAVDAYHKALELRPNFVRARANLGIAYANQGMHEEACQAYLTTLVRNPNAEHIWSYLRLSLASMGREDLISATHQRNLDIFKNNFIFE